MQRKHAAIPNFLNVMTHDSIGSCLVGGLKHWMYKLPGTSPLPKRFVAMPCPRSDRLWTPETGDSKCLAGNQWQSQILSRIRTSCPACAGPSAASNLGSAKSIAIDESKPPKLLRNHMKYHQIKWRDGLVLLPCPRVPGKNVKSAIACDCYCELAATCKHSSKSINAPCLSIHPHQIIL